MNKQELIESIEKLNKLYGERYYVAIDDVLNLVSQLDEPQKVKVPNFVADWIEYCKKHNFTLFGCLDPVNGFESLADEAFEGDIRKCIRWCRKESNNFARAWLYGYEIEKEKRYLVKIIGITDYNSYLNYHKRENKWTIESSMDTDTIRTKHTRKELEKSGFGWVFDCSGIEVREVKE